MMTRDRWAVLPQYLLPKRALTQAMGALARARGGSWTTAAIRWFVQRYGVDMSQAAESDLAAYATFNDFFTRALKPGLRPLAQADWVCPVDGAVSQFGAVEQGRIFQAKGHEYSATALLGGHASWAASFASGSFATIYLSPKDYHRIHMPRAGRLLHMVHVPGDLFSVNPTTARGVPGLFARNERVVCLFEDDEPERGVWALVLVGATVVGSMATMWHGVVNPPRPGVIRQWDYTDQRIHLAQGEEMGRFLLGSTVVLLMPELLTFESSWMPGLGVRMGEAMASGSV